MPRAAPDIRSLARAWTPSAIRTLGAILCKSESDAARVQAASILLDRGWGKAPTTHTGADGEGAVRVIIRHIIEGRDAPKIIDAKPVSIDTRSDTVSEGSGS